MTRMHRLAPQCDMLELVPPRRSKMFLKWQDLRKKEPSPNLKAKPKERLHIWQKVARVRELNILEDYYWFYEDWDRLNYRFRKSLGKTFPEILMERMHSHRIKMENTRLLDYCKKIMDAEEIDGVDQWMKTLRIYLWEPGSPAKPPWDDGTEIQKPDESIRLDPVIERIGHPDQDNRKMEYFNDQWAHTLKKQDEWDKWEWFCFQMAAKLAQYEPHYPDFTGLLIHGHHLQPTEPPPPKPLVCIEPTVDKELLLIEWLQKLPAICGPAAMISSTYHFFVSQVGDQNTKVVILENVGGTVLFYTWERRPMEALITTPKVDLGTHITDCRAFSVMNGSGSILPSEKKFFFFRFNSDIPGIFLESWMIRIAPRLSAPWTLDPIYLKGVAFSENHLWRLQEKLCRILYYREIMSGIDEFLVDTLNQAAKASRPTEEVRNASDYMFSSKAFNFLQKNLEIEPPVYYIPRLYQKIEALALVVKAWESLSGGELSQEDKETKSPSKQLQAGNISIPAPAQRDTDMLKETPWMWDGSFSSIYEGINKSSMSDRIKVHFQNELNLLKDLVQIPPRQTMLLHAAVYKILRDITNHSGDVMESIPESFGKPMAEKLMKDYYEKYEQERLQGTNEAKQRREENPESAEAEMMEKLLEQISLENPPLNEVSLETQLDNQEMLEYCFKWLHIFTEMRCYLRIGFNGYEEQIEHEQRHLVELINDRIGKLIPHVDETSKWNVFALSRAKQELLKEGK